MRVMRMVICAVECRRVRVRAVADGRIGEETRMVSTPADRRRGGVSAVVVSHLHEFKLALLLRTAVHASKSYYHEDKCSSEEDD